MRRLEVTLAGKWYLALTIIMGVVAILSGNNIIYLIESLLLSGLILSGVISERFVSGVQIDLIRSQAVAEELSMDRIRVQNLKKFPIFCVEIGEWNGKKFIPYAFVSKIDPKETVVVSSQQRFEKRGLHQWKSLVVATSYPFGFARKLKLLDSKSQRIVWPKKDHPKKIQETLASNKYLKNRLYSDFMEGEIRTITPDDDIKSVVWTLSSRHANSEDWVVRPRKKSSSQNEMILDFSKIKSENDLEKEIIKIATFFYLTNQEEDRDQNSLTVLNSTKNKKEKIKGRKKVLDYLSVVQWKAVA